MFLKLATGVSDDAMFAVLIKLRQNGAQASGLFVVSETGIDDKCIRAISRGVGDDGLGAQVGLKFLEGLQGSEGRAPFFQAHSFLVRAVSSTVSCTKFQTWQQKKLHKPRNCLTSCTFEGGGYSSQL
jgi:hypothetical protein